MRHRFSLLALAAALLAASPVCAEPGSWGDAPDKLPRAPRGDRFKNLDFLFEALKAAPDADSAKLVETRIWALWLASGSDTTDLLMSRVKTAIDDKDTNLAIELLDAVIELRPDSPAYGASAGMTARHQSPAASDPTNAIRTMLVAPGVPSGTPATMMMRWPALAKPSRNAMRQARSTMSSRSRASSSTTQCTPHTTASRRPAVTLGEIATIGDCGRSRATRITVEPENVQHAIAGRS